MLCIADCILDGVRLAIPELTEWQRSGAVLQVSLKNPSETPRVKQANQ